MSLDERVEIPVKCEQCGVEAKKSVAALKLAGNVVTCSGCGAEIHIEWTPPDGDPAGALKSISDAFKALKKRGR